MAQKSSLEDIYVTEVFASSGTQALALTPQGLSEILPNLVHAKWTTFSTFEDFQINHFPVNMTFDSYLCIVEMKHFHNLHKSWLSSMVFTFNNAVILVDSFDFTLYHHSLGTTPDTASLLPVPAIPFARVQFLPRPRHNA